jgi:hypothetical protein
MRALELDVLEDISEGAARVFGEALKVNRGLQTLSCHRENGFSEPFMSALVHALADNTELRELNLVRISISNKSLVALGEALKVNRVLRRLSISHSLLGGSVVALAEALKENKALRVLNLQYTQISKSDALAFGETLKIDTVLQELRLNSNITQDEFKSLAEAASISGTNRAPDVQVTNISGNTMVAIKHRRDGDTYSCLSCLKRCARDGLSWVLKVPQLLKDAVRLNAELQEETLNLTRSLQEHKNELEKQEKKHKQEQNELERKHRHALEEQAKKHEEDNRLHEMFGVIFILGVLLVVLVLRHIIAFLREDERKRQEQVARMIAVMKEELVRDPMQLEHLHALWDDENFVTCAVQNDPFSLQYASERLQRKVAHIAAARNMDALGAIKNVALRQDQVKKLGGDSNRVCGHHGSIAVMSVIVALELVFISERGQNIIR